MGKYDDLTDSAAQQANAALNIRFGVDAAPDEAARMAELARRYGLSPGVIAEYRPDYERKARIDDIDAVMQQSPKLRGWIAEDQYRADIAHDDVDNLGALEKTFDYLTRLDVHPGANSLAGDIGAGAMQVSKATYGLLRNVADVIGAEGLSAFFGERAALAEARQKRLSPPSEGVLQSGVSSGVQSLYQNLLTLPLGALKGARYGLGAMAGLVYGDEYQTAREHGKDVLTSMAYAGGQAGVEALTEALPVGKFISDLNQNATLRKIVLNQLAREIPGEQVATLWQDLNRWAVLEANQGKTFQDYLAERPEAAAQTLVATLIGVGGNIAVAGAIDAAQQRAAAAQRAQQHAAVIEQLDALAAASKVRGRDPAAFEEFVRQATAEGAQNFYISAHALAQSGIAEEVARVSPSVAEQFQTALATGGEVRIPVSEYAAKIAGTQYGQLLLDDIRVEGEQFTRREAQQFWQTQAEEVQREVERAIGEQQRDDAFRQSQEKVKQLVLEQLNQAGHTKSYVNEHYATLHAAHAAVRAAQLGILPEEYFARYALRVQGEALAKDEIFAQLPKGLTKEQVKVIVSKPGYVKKTVTYLIQEGVLTEKDRAAAKAFINEIETKRELRKSHKGPPYDPLLAFGGGAKRLKGKLDHKKFMEERAAKARREQEELEAMRRTGAAAAWTEDDLFGVMLYPHAGDRTIAGKAATVRAISRLAQERGYVLEHVSKKGGGESHYLRKGDRLVRVSDHDLPDTSEREYNRSRGLTGIWTDEIVTDLWRHYTIEDYLYRLDNGRFPEEKEERDAAGNQLFQDNLDAAGQPRDLVALHNLTADGLRYANNLGGLPVPSLAITKKGYAPTKFGEITLIGDSSLIDPEKGVPVFDADAYTGRFPGLIWKKVQNEKVDGFLARFRHDANDAQDDWGLADVKDALVDHPDRNEAILRMERSRFGKLAFLRTKGFDFVMPMRAPLYNYAFSNDQAIHDFIAKTGFDILEKQAKAYHDAENESGKAAPDVPELRAFSAIVRDAVKRHARSDAAKQLVADRGEEGAIKSVATAWGQSGDWALTDKPLPLKVIARIEHDIQLGTDRIPDTDKADDLLREEVARYGTEFYAWVKAQITPLFDEPAILVGRKKMPVTLDNIVEAMRSTVVAGKENTMVFGAGRARAGMAKQYGSLAQIQADRHRIVPPEEHNAAENKTRAIVDRYQAAVLDYFTVKRNGGADTLSGLESSMRALAAMGKVKNITHAKVMAALRKEGFDVPEHARAEVVELALSARQAMLDTPVDYFEAKPQRAVRLNEFLGAVIPSGTPEDVREILKQAGLSVFEYQDENGHRKVVEAAVEALSASGADVLFQGRRGAFDPDANVISLLKNADLSTFLHESAHYFFETDIHLASVLVAKEERTEGEQQILDDVHALLSWHGVQGPIEDQLRQWATMGFEEKRAYHERTAESFERYLLEGKAPSLELSRAFQHFRAWLLKVYRLLTDFLTRYPEAGKLNDEVRGVFDRMLATTEQIKLAEQARSMVPLFSSAEQAGMTPEEFAAYHALNTDATQAAIETLQAKSLRDMQWLHKARGREIKRLQRKAEGLRRALRMEVRAEVMAQPVYRAWQFLSGRLSVEDRLPPKPKRKSNPKWVDPSQDSLFVAIAKLGGLDKAATLAEWGIDPKDIPYSGVFGKPLLRVNDGRSVDEMATLLGQYGYLERDRHGKVDLHEFEDRFLKELAGDLQYSNAYEYESVTEARGGEQVANLAAVLKGKLDEDDLKMMLLHEEARLLKARGMVAKEGLHPDIVAELVGGFSSGDELVKALVAADDPKEVIEAEVDKRMLEQHAELSSEQDIAREADRAIHNELRARVLVAEANALAKAAGGAKARKLMGQAAREFAATAIARLKVRDIRPHQYAVAAERSGRIVETATDMNVKIAEKRNQVIQHYLAKYAYDALDEVEQTVRYLKKFDSEGTRRNLDAEYLDQIDKMLERFDLRERSNRKIDQRTALAKWIEEQEQEGLEPDIPKWVMNETNATHYRNLTLEELRGLRDAIEQVEHLGRLKKKLLTAKENRELDAIVAEIAAEIEKNAQNRSVDNERRNTLASHVTYAAKWMLSLHRKAASVARELDGFKDGGPMWEYFIRGMNEAGDREASMRAEAARRLHALAKPIMQGEKLGGKGRFFPLLGRSFNRGERIAMALNWGNEGNRQRLLGGKGWTPAQVQSVLDTLTAEEWTFVQGVWDFFESYRPEIAAKERRVYGKEPDWVEPTPFEIKTADGQTLALRGGYYPIKYDPLQSGKAEAHEKAEEAKTMMRAAYTAATTRRSFTKTRVEEVRGRPLKLSFDGIWQGANEVIHDLAWHEWLIDANRLLRRLDPVIRTRYGAQYMDVLNSAVRDSARGDLPSVNVMESVLTHLRIGSTIVGLGWNLTTAMLQPLGFANSIVRVGAPWVARGLGRLLGSPGHMIKTINEINEKSMFMRNRGRTMLREINDIRNQLEADKSEARLFMESSFFVLIQKLQAMVDYPTWMGAYEKAISEGKDEARAVALADQAVLDSQGGGQIKDLSQVQRGHPAWKLWTNFYSFFNVVLQLSVERAKATNFKKPGEVAALAGDYLLLLVVPAVLGALVRDALAGGDDDDDDELLRKIINEQISYLAGLVMFGREATVAIQAATTGDTHGIGYTGPAGARLIAEATKLGQQLHQGDADMTLFKAADNVGGILFHYPSGQINRTVEGTAALLEGRTDNPLAPVVGAPSR